jgi:lipopolysaccharide/colanic/teichoic acid biosynthesis glycosyltransferase
MTGPRDVQEYIERDVAVTFRHDRGYARRQRAIDLAVGIAGLLVTAPILGIATFAVWLEDRGSPLFVQQRVGQYGRLFNIYKLRTMRLDDCTDAVSPLDKGDSRVTRVGGVLRKTSVDELPQLWNVVRGDMTLVGPRPEMPFIVNQYERWQHCRHLRKPGITGLWQISVRKSIPLHRPDATKIDLEYIRIASTRADGMILMRTLVSLLRAEGAF